MAFMPWRNKPGEADPAMPSMATLRSEIDRLLDTFIREPFGVDWPFGLRGVSPPVDLAETNEEVLVRVELPGVTPEDLEVTVAGGELVLAGEKKDISVPGGPNYYHTESRSGRFRRAIPLNQAVDPDQVEAEYLSGVLTIRLKKIATAPPKRVNVKVRPAEAAPGPGPEPPASSPSPGPAESEPSEG